MRFATTVAGSPPRRCRPASSLRAALPFGAGHRFLPPALRVALPAALLLALGLGAAQAGVIDPPFERHLQPLPDDQLISVLIYLEDQVPIAALDAELRAERATLAVRHERVVTSLQAKAAARRFCLLCSPGRTSGSRGSEISCLPSRITAPRFDRKAPCTPRGSGSREK